MATDNQWFLGVGRDEQVKIFCKDADTAVKLFASFLRTDVAKVRISELKREHWARIGEMCMTHAGDRVVKGADGSEELVPQYAYGLRTHK